MKRSFDSKKRTALRSLVALAVAACAGLTAPSLASADLIGFAPVTISTPGPGTVLLGASQTPGGLLASSGVGETCYDTGSAGGFIYSGTPSVSDGWLTITPSTAAGSAYQTVKYTQQLQWWNGSQWVNWSSSSGTMYIQAPSFGGSIYQAFNVYHGFYYRIRISLAWYAGSTFLGSATFGLTTALTQGTSTLATLQGTTEVGCWIP